MSTSSSPIKSPPLLWSALFAAVLLGAALIRLHLLSLPLERDEGEYAYAGQLLLQGIAPFKEAYNMKMPGIYAVYAAVMALFGQTIEGIHLGLLMASLLGSVAVFILGRRLFSPLVGCAAGCSYAVMSLSPSVLGLSAHAEHFVVVAALSGALLLCHALESRSRRWYLPAGLLIGVGVTIMQHAVLFAAFGAACVIYIERAHRQSSWRASAGGVALFSLGAVIPLVLVCAWMALCGVFHTFWFWTFDYAREYVSLVGPVRALHAFSSAVTRIGKPTALCWVFVVIGCGGLLTKRFSRDVKFFAVAFFVFSFLSVCPGLYFRQHYFVLLLPAAALLCGVGVESAAVLIVRRSDGKPSLPAALAFVALVVLFPLLREWQLLSQSSSARLSHQIFYANPFPEAIEIAEYIKARSLPSDRIAVIGSEPQIYFYAHRRAATGYLYTYPMMENHKFARRMQDEMIRQIEDAAPRYLVFVDTRTSWLDRSFSDRHIFQWFDAYQREHYRLVGVLDVISDEKTEVIWGPAARSYVPTTNSWLAVLERNPPS